MLTTKQAASIAGMPIETLQDWARNRIVRPAVAGGRGRGKTALYGFRELVQVLTLRTLRGEGISMQAMRKIVAALRKRGDDIASVRFVITDGRVCVVDTDDELIDALTKQMTSRHLIVTMKAIVRQAQRHRKTIREVGRRKTQASAKTKPLSRGRVESTA